MLEFARRLIFELNINNYAWSDYGLVFSIYFVFWVAVYFFINFLYYKILLYIVYGETLPK